MCAPSSQPPLRQTIPNLDPPSPRYLYQHAGPCRACAALVPHSAYVSASLLPAGAHTPVRQSPAHLRPAVPVSTHPRAPGATASAARSMQAFPLATVPASAACSTCRSIPNPSARPEASLDPWPERH
ncbi:hypothetical protein EVG20_g10889 [Dentipellis fragilis]|uniref:Uncharacterized protein n=1 Tax=Dentipellis fragilis TaxID=205917 RepID=A0A4Y9XPK0_9AGAM|nr:hypothetical protein EVG20_g10889 [Dentipellis fragilis]